MALKSKDAKRVREFDINTYTKGFLSVNTTDNIITQEYFQYKEIQQIIYYPDTGVEVVFFSGKRRVFYNDAPSASLTLFNSLNASMVSWMNSNLN